MVTENQNISPLVSALLDARPVKQTLRWDDLVDSFKAWGKSMGLNPDWTLVASDNCFMNIAFLASVMRGYTTVSGLTFSEVELQKIHDAIAVCEQKLGAIYNQSQTLARQVTPNTRFMSILKSNYDK